jgi:hypothetical protein
VTLMRVTITEIAEVDTDDSSAASDWEAVLHPHAPAVADGPRVTIEKTADGRRVVHFDAAAGCRDAEAVWRDAEAAFLRAYRAGEVRRGPTRIATEIVGGRLTMRAGIHDSFALRDLDGHLRQLKNGHQAKARARKASDASRAARGESIEATNALVANVARTLRREKPRSPLRNSTWLAEEVAARLRQLRGANHRKLAVDTVRKKLKTLGIE